MGKSAIFSSFILLFFLGQVLAQVPTLYGTSDVHNLMGIAPAADGYVAVGQSYVNGKYDLVSVKLDTAGGFEMANHFSNASHLFGMDIAHNQEGYLLAGITYDSNESGDIYLVQMDSLLNNQWSKTYGGSRLDKPTSSVSTPDGGHLIVGLTHSNDGDFSGSYGGGDGFVLKIDSDGNKQWVKQFGGSRLDQLNEIVRTRDGHYIAIGTTLSDDGDISNQMGHSDLWVIKMDESGTPVWSQTYGNHTFDFGHSIHALQSGDYVICGSQNIVSPAHPENILRNNQQLLVKKLDGVGQELWSKTFGNKQSESAAKIWETSEGGLLVAGWAEAYDSLYWDIMSAYRDMTVLKLTAAGELDWQVRSTSQGSEWASDMVPDLAGSSFAVVGSTSAVDGLFAAHPPTEDGWFFKLYEASEVIVGNTEITNQSNILTYPNPTFGPIEVSTTEDEPASIHLIHPDGKVRSISIEHGVLDLSSYPKGIYYIKFNWKNGEVVKKVIVQ